MPHEPPNKVDRSVAEDVDDVRGLGVIAVAAQALPAAAVDRLPRGELGVRGLDADIQDAMGHADHRTTRRYTATHQHLDQHATYASLHGCATAAEQPPGDEGPAPRRADPGPSTVGRQQMML